MATAAASVVRRFLAKSVWAAEQFRPPLPVVNAVDEGKLDPHVLLYWKAVVETIWSKAQERGRPAPVGSALYAAAVEYWRNKCAANGYPLPKEYLEGLGGPGAEGPWKIKTGDQVEDWVKQTLLSQNLISTLEKTAAEWEMEITSLTAYLDDAQDRASKHKENLAKAKSPAGVAQKQKWLDGALKDIEKFTGELKTAKEKLGELTAAAQKKSQAQNFSIEFEKEFQFLMMVAKKDLDKKAVLESVKKAIERFEAGLDIPDAQSPAHDIGRYEGPSGKTAGILDTIAKGLVKAWEYLKGAFDYFTDWVAGLVGTTQKIDQMLKQAGA